MAGGGGTRLWPLSREKFPKQFQQLTGRKSLLQITIERISAVPGVQAGDIFISTNTSFIPFVAKQTGVISERIIAEPCRRDNAAAILLTALKIRQVLGREDEVIGMFAADHMITNKAGFHAAVQTGEHVARDNPGAIVAMGVRPTYPETGYGYIEMGDKVERNDGFGVPCYRVSAFREKPDAVTAQIYLESFRYLWNMCVFCYRIDTILRLYERFLPDMYAALSSVPFGSADEEKILNQIYPTLQSTSIDYGILEHTKDIFVLPLENVGWSDVGHFKSLWEVLPKDASNNVIEGKNVLLQNTSDSIVYGNGRLIACVGLENVVVVDTGDVLLVTTKEASQDIKSFLKSEGMKGRGEFL
jgi:mannose-1-phosphate guanylyltransferase